MASTLNSVPDGLTFSADSSGALNIQANGITAIEIGSGASVTLANAPVLSSPLAASSGGTGLTSAGALGNILTSDGTDWVSQAPAPGGAQDYIVQSYGIV